MADKKKDLRKLLGETAFYVWGEIAPTIPDIIKTISSQTETALKGKYKDATLAILKKMDEDIVAFKNKEIDRIEYEDLVGRRKAAIFALYNANKISNQKPSIQKVLSAAETIATTLLVKAVPAIIAAAL